MIVTSTMIKDADTAPSSDMRNRNLDRLLNPRSIAFIGGTRAISAWRVTRRKGFTGQLYMVNPLKPEIDGIDTYASVAGLPEAPDATYIALDPLKTIAAVEVLSARGAGGVVVFGTGFSEVGEDGARLERELLEKSGDLALIGPNCYGLINHVSDGSLWPIEYQKQDLPPCVAIISQSGNVAISLAESQRSVPLTHVVSLGNQAGIQVHDLIDHFAAQPGMRAIGIYLDGLKDIRRFHDSASRALRAGVGLVVLKAGDSEVSASIAMSHTNSLAGSRELYEALFDRVGVAWANTIPEMLETLKVFALWNMAPGDRMAFFSCSGGESSMAADFAEAAGLTMNAPNEAQKSALRAILPAYGFVSNPLDLTTAMFGKGAELSAAVEVMMRGDSDVAVLVMDFASDDIEPGNPNLRMAEGLARACKKVGKRAVVASMKPESISVAVQKRLLDMDVLPLQGLDVGLIAIASGARAAQRRTDVAECAPVPLLAAYTPGPTKILNEWDSKRLLAPFGVTAPKGRLVAADAVAAAAEEIGYPVVVKACSDRLPHKTEAGAVMLKLNDAGEVRHAVETIQANVARYDATICVDHFLVEEMVNGVVSELILGIKNDPQFGPAIVIGTGGIFVELLKDARTLLLPTDARTVARTLRGLAGAPLFSGFRGRPLGDVDAIVEVVLALARFAQENSGTVLEVDINPLFVLANGQGVRAGDALVRRVCRA